MTELREQEPTAVRPRSSPAPGRPVDPVLVVVVIAWVSLVGAGLAGGGAALDHDALLDGHLSLLAAVGVFVPAWAVMVAATMLPSTLPLARLFRASADGDLHPRAAQAAFYGGYGLVWALFGCAALVADGLLHRLVEATPWLEHRPSVVTGSLLLLAGAAQFLPLTQACLRSCRHPFAYLLEHYRTGTRAAFHLGRDHGLWCLGCCWALMLVMFAVGVADVAAMVLLTAIMAYQKVGRRGEEVAVVVGIVLIVVGAASIGGHLV